tara:strand:+ start:10076 stop:10558 length:483 start_codon:yes stop_codon:yes gene_type:complete
MIDPITLGTAVTIASQTYGQIKKLIQHGKDIEEMSDTIGKWMGAVSDIDNINKSSSNPSTFDKLFNGSVEEVAMQSYSAKLKIQKQREELKNWIVGHYGLQGWENLLKEEGRIRRQRNEAIYQREEQKRMIRDYSIIGFAVLIGIGALGWMLWIVSVSVA